MAADRRVKCYILPARNWRRVLFEAAAAKWCYIGKDMRLRHEILTGAPADRRLRLGNRLREVAEQIRGPYLRFVAHLGRKQEDRTGWWASAFASKSPFYTDFFLLVCYKVLVLQLLDDWNDRDDILFVLVDDPWLFVDLKASLSRNADVQFIGSFLPLWVMGALRLARGVVARLLLGGSLVLTWTAMAALWRKRNPIGISDQPTVGIMSFAEARSLDGPTFKDPYFGRLGEVLEARGIRVVRLIFPFFRLSLAHRIAQLSGAAWPMVLDFRPWDLVRLLAVWQPRIEKNLSIGTYPVDLLIRREVLIELGRALFNRDLILKDLLGRFLSRRRVSSLVYLFENQPWEKMACLAAQNVGEVHVVAHQHSTVPRFLLTYFLDEGEAASVPLPHTILTNGPYATALLRDEGGYPPRCIVEGGSWRYAYLLQPPPGPEARPPIRTLLVALPVDRSLAQSIWLRMLEAAQAPPVRSWRLVVKPHPSFPLRVLGASGHLAGGIEFSDAPFERLLQGAEVIVAQGTTIVEAWLRGKIVIRPRYDNRLDLDPVVDEDGAGIRAEEDDCLPQAIVEYALSHSEPPGPAPARQNVFFSPPQPEVWLREIVDGHR